MQENPFAQRILDGLSQEQQKSSDDQRAGIEEWQLPGLIDLDESNDRDYMAYQDALNYLKRRGLIYETTYHGLSLTERGWMETLGRVPDVERQDDLLVAIVDVWEKDHGGRSNEDLDVKEAYRHLNWDEDVAQAITLSERLQEDGFLNIIAITSTAHVQPTYSGIQRAEQLRKRSKR